MKKFSDKELWDEFWKNTEVTRTGAIIGLQAALRRIVKMVRESDAVKGKK